MKGKVEVATEKQAKGLVYNCDKILVTPGVRFSREPCCPDKGHCVNLEEGGIGGGCWRTWQGWCAGSVE